jgi:methylthioribose-1-phosphate isomerase
MPEAGGVSGLRSLYYRPQSNCVEIIDQTLLPTRLVWVQLCSLDDFCHAIERMQVRGAPLIGVTAAFALALELCRNPDPGHCKSVVEKLVLTRPTAVNLRWAVDRVAAAALEGETVDCGERALAEALRILDADISVCRSIGDHGLGILQGLIGSEAGARPLQIMTHCNAGWLAALEWGTALAPVYVAAQAGLSVHVWVSETRPRNQGAGLTCWELDQAGIPYTLIADNAAGHLLQRSEVDCVLVGSDRTAANGDVCNKIGTYLKALAARQAKIPFYVALPSSTVDWNCTSGAQIPIEERDCEEVLSVQGRDRAGDGSSVWLAPPTTRAYNPAFDVTPADLVTGLITEFGCIPATPAALQQLRELIEG